MGLAFWRSKKRAANAGDKPASLPPQSQDDDVDQRLDPAAGMRARARHRLIGASALLLAVAIVVPMVLDPDPKPVAENIPIDIPSERAPFTPRLSLPPVPAADAAGTPPPDQAPVAAPIKAESKADTAVEAKADATPEPKATAKPEGKVDEGRAAAKAEEPRKGIESAAPTEATKAGKFAVQAAAPASEKAARDLVDRLKKGGFAAYTEKVETKDGTRYRVRVGPYSTRDDAEKARARLKSQGINGNLVAP
jgi:DedD protein